MTTPQDEALRGTITAAYRTACLAGGKTPSAGEVLAVIKRWSETAIVLDDVKRLCLEFSLQLRE